MDPVHAPRRPPATRADAGFVLPGVLVLLAICAALALRQTERATDLQARTALMIAHDRHLQTALAVEAVASRAIIASVRPGTTIDLHSPLLEPRVFTIGSGTVEGRLVDLQGRFNLNNVVRTETGEPHVDWIVRLRRLLVAVRVDPRIAEAAIDWIDPDGRPQASGGAEDAAYLRGMEPYRTANHPLLSIGELRLIAGMDDARTARLLPHVTALPGTSAINVNTASPEVLMSLHADLDRVTAERLAGRARATPFVSTGAFVAAVVAEFERQGHSASELDIRTALSGAISVSSTYFQLEARVVGADGVLAITSIIAREETGARVLSRSIEVLR